LISGEPLAAFFSMTKLFSTLFIAGLIAAGFTVMTFSQDLARDSGYEHSDSPLEEIMEQMKDHMRAVRKSIPEVEQHAKCIKDIQAMQQLAIDALPYCPDYPGEAGVEKAKYEINFKRQLLTVADTLLELELALHKGDIEAANAHYKSLRNAKESSHEIYDPEDDD
tara:strand:- start:78 stop:575 length:498 start_codon:yes stop_codon:yes gene_type:complete